MEQWICGEEPAMAQAILAAQSSFGEFVRQAELEWLRPQRVFEEVAIKAFFPHPQPGQDGEHLFATFVAWDGQLIEAVLDADPYFLPDLVEGQRVLFPTEFLSDWLLVYNGRGLGGFTLEATLDYLTPEQRREYQLAPPYVYVAQRQNSALSELQSLPLCVRCGQRDLILELYEEGVCGPCQQGYVRLECQLCGAPILRHPAQLPHCTRCKQQSINPRQPQPEVGQPEMPPSPAHERRRSFRLNRMVGAEITLQQDLIPARLFVLDISLSGFRATSHFSIPDQVTLNICLFLEPATRPIESLARVVWQKPLAGSATSQYGFEFQSISPEQARRLEDFIEEERRRSRSPLRPTRWVTWSSRYFDSTRG